MVASSVRVFVALVEYNVSLTINIFLPDFLITPDFSKSKTFLRTLSLGINKSFEII